MWGRCELTFWGEGRGAQVWAHRVWVQGHKQRGALGLRCGPALQRDYEPVESSLDLQEGVSEEGWVSPTPDTEQENQHSTTISPAGGTHSQTVAAQACWPPTPLSGLRAVLPMQLAMRGPVMWF